MRPEGAGPPPPLSARRLDAYARPAMEGTTARVREERHRDKRIFVVDVSGLAAEGYQPVLAEAIARIRREPPASVLLATVVKNVKFGVGAGDHARAYSAAIRRHLKAGAVVGLSPFSKVVFLTVKPFLHRSTTAFDDLASAKEWLAGFE